MILVCWRVIQMLRVQSSAAFVCLHCNESLPLNPGSVAVRTSSFNLPTSFMLADASKNKGDPAGWEKLKALPSFFDASDIVVEQHFVNSKDGTKIPYFQVGSAKAAAGPNSPTLLCARTPPASVTARGLFVTGCDSAVTLWRSLLIFAFVLVVREQTATVGLRSRWSRTTPRPSARAGSSAAA